MIFPRYAVFILMATTPICNGCIFERIFRVKKQLCDVEENFQIEVRPGFRVILREPVMLDEDITWLAGAEPSGQMLAGDQLVMTYLAERKSAPSEEKYDLPIKLQFVRLEGEYRLKEGYLGENLADLLTVELLTQLMQSVCESEKSLVKQHVIIDISSLDRTLLPNRSEITRILGPPNPNSNRGQRLVYDYEFKNNDAEDIAAVIEIYFDDSDNRPDRLKLKYLRYHLDADFKKGVAILKVDIFEKKDT